MDKSQARSGARCSANYKFNGVIPFGGYKGKTLEEVPYSYLIWLSEIDLSSNPDMKEAVKLELNSRPDWDGKIKHGNKFYNDNITKQFIDKDYLVWMYHNREKFNKMYKNFEVVMRKELDSRKVSYC